MFDFLVPVFSAIKAFFMFFKPVLDFIIDTKVPEQVEAIDYKTNRVVPEAAEQVPEGLKRQMGAYLEALEAIFPDKEIDVSILWTETCTRMVLPHVIVRSALQRATIS